MKLLEPVVPWGKVDADKARLRYENKQQRLQQKAQEKAERLKKQKQMLSKAMATK
jgi:hypothetical protein